MPDRAEQLTGNKLGDADKVVADCKALDEELTRIKVAYEQYFLGLERRPPSKDHADFKKKLVELRSNVVRAVVAKVKVQNLAQRFSTYERLWDRTLKEIESGTYRRDLYKAKLHSEKRKEPKDKDKKEKDKPKDDEAPSSDGFDIEEAVEEQDPFSAAPLPPTPLPTELPSKIQPLTVSVSSVVTTQATTSGSKPAITLPPKPSVPVNANGLPALTAPLPTSRPSNPSLPPASTSTSGSNVAVPPRPIAAALSSGPKSAVTAPSTAPAVTSGPKPAVASASTSGAKPAVAAPATTSGPKSAVTAPPATSSGPRPAVTGVRPALSPSTSQPRTAMATPGATTSQPMRPISTGNNPALKPAEQLSDNKIKAIYDAYVTAKRRCGEDTSKLSIESVGDTLRKQVPELMKQHKAKSVEFKVVIKDGKAVLRALPKE